MTKHTKEVQVVMPTEVIAEAKRFGQYGGHVIIPGKWMGKTVRMILMTAVMVSLFHKRRAILARTTVIIAFAKKTKPLILEKQKH